MTLDMLRINVETCFIDALLQFVDQVVFRYHTVTGTALPQRGINLAKGRDIVAVDSDRSVGVWVNIEVFYKAYHKKETTVDSRKLGVERVNVVRSSITRAGAINVYVTLEFHRFDIGHNFPAEGSLLLLCSTITYECYVTVSGGICKSLEVTMCLSFITQEDMDVSNYMAGGFRKGF